MKATIKEKWLKFKIHTYERKYKRTLSEAVSYQELSLHYSNLSKTCVFNKESNLLNNHNISEQYAIKSEYYRNLAQTYLEKKHSISKELSFSKV